VHPLLQSLRDTLHVHILAFEYPGYGLSAGRPNSTSIDAAAFKVVNFLTTQLLWPSNQILLCGQSLGTGPATKIAAMYKFGALLLISAFISLKEVASNLMGRVVAAGVASYWENGESIAKVECPTLFIHGQKDRLVPHEHSLTLYDKCHQTDCKDLQIIDGVGHNNISHRRICYFIHNFLHKKVFVAGLRPQRFSLHVHERALTKTDKKRPVGANFC